VGVLYLDASAAVKLVLDEPESDVLRAYLGDADLVSCELLLAEVPRSVWRAAARDPRLPDWPACERWPPAAEQRRVPCA
jgi:predicted nucleic acid-binding protein